MKLLNFEKEIDVILQFKKILKWFQSVGYNIIIFSFREMTLLWDMAYKKCSEFLVMFAKLKAK